MEAQGVVDRPDATVVASQDMTRLPVGVVGDEVEHGQAPQLVCPGRIFAEREVVLPVVTGHVQLDRPFAERTVADHGWWNEAPTEVAGQLPCGGFAPVEAGGEIPQGALTPARLVHTLDDVVSRGGWSKVDQKRAVGRPRHLPQEGQVAGREQRQRHPVVDGAACPERGIRGRFAGRLLIG